MGKKLGVPLYEYYGLETLKLTIPNKGTGTDAIKGVLILNRKHYGMNKGIPFVRIEDHVEAIIDLKVKQVSGPSLIYRQ